MNAIDTKTLSFLQHNATFNIPTKALSMLLNPAKDAFIFVKDHNSHFLYGNPAFIELMGLKCASDLTGRTDAELTRDQTKVQRYREDDAIVREEERELTISETVLPRYHSHLTQHLTGQLFPLYQHKSTPVATLGICRTSYHPFKLSIDILFSMTPTEIHQWLRKPSYPICVNKNPITISRRELQCVLELIKGKHAGEIAAALCLKQTTVESYLINLKNKLGVSLKSDLIQIIFKEKILEQVIL